MLDERAEVQVQRQILRDLRRAILGVMAVAATQNGITLAQVSQGIHSGNVPPDFARQWQAFTRTIGLPRDQILILCHEVATGGVKEDESYSWEITDLQVVVNAYANCGQTTTQDQMNEITELSKRVTRTARRRERQRGILDTLVRQATGIPGEGQASERQ